MIVFVSTEVYLADLTKLKKRFEAKVLVSNNGCWIWQGYRLPGGYGQFGIVSDRMKLAHRVAYALYKGHLGGLDVCHKCDTPSCVNPDHLFLGTHRQNILDMHAKGRANTVRGSRHHKTKLSIDAVKEIRSSLGNTAALSRKFGVSKSAIKNVRRGTVWKEIV